MAISSLPAIVSWCIAAASMLGAIGLAIWFAAPPGRWRERRVRPKALVRALLPRRMLRSASGRLDIAWLLFSLLLAGTTMGWALLSSGYFAAAGDALLARTFDRPAMAAVPGWLAATVTTLALFLAYEFAYWLDHYLSHRFAVLWEFHKVHHSAESLSLLTNYRVHPVDTILFYNIAAACTGLTAALLGFVLGRPADPISVGGSNLLIFVTSMTLTHLQHSHLWISLPGRWGRWLLSPAHHQIHHSIDETHHNRNLGSTIALFDWIFGTLHLPAARRERLTFGVSGLDYDPNGFKGAVLMPFVEAGGHVARALRQAIGDRRPDPRTAASTAISGEHQLA